MPTLASSYINNFQTSILNWYQKSQRNLPWRVSGNPYYIWLSEVMLQQTQVVTVIPYFHQFIKTFPNIYCLAKADLQAVLKCWEGLGYYARARNFHKAIGIVVNQLEGKIPDDYKIFRNLPGVGDYIAAAVQSIAFNQPYAVVDGNVKRVLARLFLIKNAVNDSKAIGIFSSIAARLLEQYQPGNFNQALMELGALICRPQNPLCTECPIQHTCLAFAENRQHEFPIRKTRKKIPEYNISVGVIYKGQKVLITKRAEKGLLGGLWEFPGGKIKPGETPEQTCIREIQEEINLKVNIRSYLTQIKHAYTHFKITMDIFICNYLSGEIQLKGPVAYKWIFLEQIVNHPFPKANHKFIPLLSSLTANQ